MARGECFPLFFGLVARLAPLRAAGDARGRRLRPVAPGVGAPTPVSRGEVAFVLPTLATGAVDGFSTTFLRLDATGIDPLELSGRSAVALDSSIGLIAFRIMSPAWCPAM